MQVFRCRELMRVAERQQRKQSGLAPLATPAPAEVPLKGVADDGEHQDDGH
jgi:hypothetical protein